MARKKRYQLQDGELAQYDERPSRSAKKRQATALQTLGEELLRLSPEACAELPADLCEALLHFRTLKSHEARRRQQQYVGRLMRDLDDATLQTITRLAASTKNSVIKLDFTGEIA